MKKAIRVFSYILTALVSCVVTLVVMLALTRGSGMTKLQELEALIDQCYIGQADKTAMYDAAAHAMIEALGDRWSYYIPASEYESYVNDKNNEYVGIGITVVAAEDGSGILVTEVTQGSPALEAGLRAGDILVEVDGTALSGKTVAEAGDLIRGPAGKQVSLKLVREGETRTLTVTCRHIQVPVATGQLLEGDIGLVTISNFNANCFNESKQVIESLLAQGAQKLLFDVRFNGGGYAEEMVELLDYLLPECDQIFRTVAYNGREKVYKSDKDCLDVPMAVLVNDSSYSAAECFAAALNERLGSAVIGEKTSGKGYYQVVYELSDGSAVGLSIGKYYTPNNNNLEGVGLTPTVPVEVDDETYYAIYAGTLSPMEDPQIVAAVNALKAG